MSPADPPTRFEPLISDWGRLWATGMAFMGGTQGQLPQLPNSYNVPYGSDLITGSLNDISRSALQGSRSYAYGLDEEAFSRNFSNIIGRTMAQFGAQLSDGQKRTLRKAADVIARYGQAGLGVAEQLLSQEGDSGTAMAVVRVLKRGFEAMYGPAGPRVPLYSALSNLSENIPLRQRDELLMRTMQEISPVNGRVPGGFDNRQAASILASAASMGYNIMTDLNTDISQEITAQSLSNSIQDINFGAMTNAQEDFVRSLSSSQTEKSFADMTSAGNLTQALNQSIVEGVDPGDIAGRMQAGSQISSFLDISNRIRGIKGFEDKSIKTFNDMISMRADIEAKAKDVKDAKQKDYYQRIINDINTLENSVQEPYRGMDIQEELNKAQSLQIRNLLLEAKRLNIYTGEGQEEQQKDFVLAMTVREQLSAYGVSNLDAWAEDDRWKELLEGANEDKKMWLTEYYKKGGLHEKYTQARKDISNQDFQKTLDLLERYQSASSEEQKRMLEDVPGMQEIINTYGIQEKVKKVADRYQGLMKSSSIMQTALAASGTPLDEQQLMAFVNKVTYGGLGNMSAESLNNVVEQIGSGMLDSGATGNDLMQMAGRGAEAAASIGGNAQAGAINAMQAGLAARITAKAMNIDPSKAQEIAARAAGMSNKSLIEKTYNALGTFMQGKTTAGTNAEYDNIINKIQHNENLTREELNTLYRQGEDIMSYAGMSADQQHSYLNATYFGGALANAASRAGTTWLMNSTIMQESMEQNIKQRLPILEGFEDKDADILTNALMSTVENLDRLTSLTDTSGNGLKKFTEQFQKQFQKQLQDLKDSGKISEEEYNRLQDQANNLTSTDISKLQVALNLATGDTANMAGRSIEEFVTGIKLSSSNPETRLRIERMAALRHLAPEAIKKGFGNFIDTLATGSGDLSTALSTLITSVNDATLNDADRRNLFYSMSVATLTDPTLAQKAKIDEDETKEASDMLNTLYGKVSNDPESMSKLHRYLSGELKEKDLTPEELEAIKSVDINRLQTIINKGAKFARDEYYKIRGDVKFAGDQEELPAVEEPPAAPVSTTGTPSASSGTPKATPEPGTTVGGTDPKKPLGSPGNPITVTWTMAMPVKIDTLGQNEQTT